MSKSLQAPVSGFSLLPFELRHQIWLEFLADQPGRIYQFSLAPPLVPGGDIVPDSREHWHRRGRFYAHPVSSLAQASKPGRTLDQVCRESRAVARKVLPDSLEFFLSEYANALLDDGESSLQEAPALRRRRFLSGVLRYDASKDMISILSNVAKRQYFLDARLRSDAPPFPGRGIKRLGVPASSFNEYRDVMRPTARCPARCEGPSCASGCELDNFPAWVRLFPDLTQLYIIDDTSPGYSISMEGCKCLQAVDSYKHAWPRIKGVEWNPKSRHPFQWAWYVVRDETPDCPFLLPIQVECLRSNRYWVSHDTLISVK
ncbi:unnamed protein product [Parascedosporium putredinis]|uniref:2EXR domain-containing protein n=1 Tax=Parascedosporium putredinis TaxID=1442378 RepID=A0A9P1H0H3_9PEZI|nr:unnamed protein product [Parascedosporium putredinis]CAI7992667.1 unnamed protein product [Parascedosporium putredinis]